MYLCPLLRTSLPLSRVPSSHGNSCWPHMHLYFLSNFFFLLALSLPLSLSLCLALTLSSSPEDEQFMDILFVKKGKKLLVRALPLLFQQHVLGVFFALMRNLPMLVTQSRLAEVST